MPSGRGKKKVDTETTQNNVVEINEPEKGASQNNISEVQDVISDYQSESNQEASKESSQKDEKKQEEVIKMPEGVSETKETKSPKAKDLVKKSIGHLSLKNMLTNSANSEAENSNNEFVDDSDEDVKKALEAINNESLNIAWNKLQQHFNLKGEVNFTNIILAAKPNIKDGLLYVTVINKIQKKTFEQNIEEVLLVLKKELKLNKLKLYFEEEKLDDGSSVPYTDKEKFAVMAGKNPELIKLKDAFGLEPDF